MDGMNSRTDLIGHINNLRYEKLDNEITVAEFLSVSSIFFRITPDLLT
jgi:hypothetical protein